MRSTALILLLLTTTAVAQTTKPTPAAEFKNGRWQAVAAPTLAPTPDADLDRAEALLKTHDPTAAETILLAWVKSHDRHAPNRDRCLMLIAQAKYDRDEWYDRIYAFYYLDELMDEYADSTLFFPALRMQYQIAETLLAGDHKFAPFGIPIETFEEEGIEMLYRVQLRNPGSELAERALLRTADFYFGRRDYDLAHDAYVFFARSYPRSAQLPRVKLRQALASLAQFRGPKFDPTSVINARFELTDFAMAYPDLAAEEDIGAIIKRIDDTLAEKLYLEGDFYRRTHKPKSAVYMYRYVIATYPNSPLAEKAKADLAKMPADSLTGTPPKAGTEYVPPTEEAK